jgi:hypothetical protein
MRHVAALAFFLKRSEDIIAAGQITTTAETIHGLLRLDGERLVLQWRAVRETDYVGREIRSDKEIDPLREVELPLSAIASAAVRASWLPLRGARLVLTAADLRAFEHVVGKGGLRLDHPAELVLRLRLRDRIAAQEFAAELQLALAELALEGEGEAVSDALSRARLRERLRGGGSDVPDRA